MTLRSDRKTGLMMNPTSTASATTGTSARDRLDTAPRNPVRARSRPASAAVGAALRGCSVSCSDIGVDSFHGRDHVTVVPGAGEGPYEASADEHEHPVAYLELLDLVADQDDSGA